MKELDGRTAFITGAAGGIGLCIARALAARGMDIALADVDRDRLRSASADIGAIGVKAVGVFLDVTDFDSWTIAVDEAEAALGPVALLVNNAGIGGGGPIATEDPKRWKLVLEVNALGPFYGCRTLLPRMLDRGDPAYIVNIASLSGLKSHPGMSSYDASKHALVGMSDSLRGELDGSNVGLSVVYPGTTRTQFVENSIRMIEERTNPSEPIQNVGDMLKHGMAPDKLAERVVRAIVDGQADVFTHADWKPQIAAAFAARLAAFDDGADPDFTEKAGLLAEKTDTLLRGAATSR